MTKTQQKIEQIHREFNTAGETLLNEAKLLIADRQKSAEKAERLKAAGFKQANEVKANEGFFFSKELIDLIQYYQQKYPFNKFITRDQVLAINKKYNLVAGPVEKYTGFVPDKNLKQIEAFKIDKNDVAEDTYKVNLSRFNADGKNDRVAAKFPDFVIPKSHFWVATTSAYVCITPKEYTTDNIVSIDSYEIQDNHSKMICAPLKDMDVKGLKQKDSIFSMFKTVHVPDPVVLQPVRGGYLIVTAWGDEASDDIVVNSINN